MDITQNLSVREIEPSDNQVIETIIRTVSVEFGSDPKTTILGDPCIRNMYGHYNDARSVYFIAASSGTIFGGCGIKQLDGTEENICELQRMFLIPEARGLGVGKKLLEMCIEKAMEFEYDKIYLESLKPMKAAIALYKKLGFREISTPLGNTGHTGCNVFMLLELRQSGN